MKATDDYVEILENCPIEKAKELVEEVKNKQAILKENIIKYGFEKDHFIYGINDWGEKVGSYENEEGKMYLNPQTWAVMAGIFNEKGSNELMDHVEKNLKWGRRCGQKAGQEGSPAKEVCTQRKKKGRHWLYTTKPNP